MTIVIPERTIDAWLSIAIARIFPSAWIWLPTNNAQAGDEPWDILALVSPTSRVLVTENKALSRNSKDELGIDFSSPSSRKQLDQLPGIGGLRVLYALPGPCVVDPSVGLSNPWLDTKNHTLHSSVSVGRPAMRLGPTPFEHWLYLIDASWVANAVGTSSWLPCSAFRLCTADPRGWPVPASSSRAGPASLTLAAVLAAEAAQPLSAASADRPVFNLWSDGAQGIRTLETRSDGTSVVVLDP